MPPLRICITYDERKLYYVTRMAVVRTSPAESFRGYPKPRSLLSYKVWEASDPAP